MDLFQKWMNISLVLRLFIGLIIGAIRDSVETALNSSGDAIFTATAEFYTWKKEGRELPL